MPLKYGRAVKKNLLCWQLRPGFQLVLYIACVRTRIAGDREK